MAGLSGSLLQAGLALKINQVKRAASSYAHDRAAQGQGIVASYAVAAGFYAVAGIFMIAAVLVGVTALFRWIEINYGLFWAFGAVGGTLLLIAIICAGVAASRLKRPAKQFPSLTSRLRVAIKANPIAASPAKPDRVASAQDTATAILSAPAEPLAANSYHPRYTRRARRGSQDGRAALIVVASLLGWAMARRHSNARKAKV
jgi:hypothetical protein